ncbi:tetratricopeptide repeat protein [Clostridiaceae bacterium 35-E11]
MKRRKSIIFIICIMFFVNVKGAYGISTLTYLYNQEGMHLMEEGQYKEAIDSFNQSLTFMPKYESEFLKNPNKIYDESDELWDSPLNNLSWAYYELRDYKKSVEYIKQSLRILPNGDIEYINAANSFLGLGEWDEALKYYDQALAQNKENHQVYFGKGMIYYEQEEYKKALGEFNKYLEHDSTEITPHLYKAFCYLYDQKGEQALQYVNKLMKDYPNTDSVYAAKAEILRLIGDYQDIKKFYNDYIAKFSQKGNLEGEAGKVAYDHGMYEDAVKYFSKAVEKDEKNEYFYVWLGYTYRSLGNLNKVSEYAAKALNLNNKNFFVYNLLGTIEMDKEYYLNAIQYFDKSIELEPTYEVAYEDKLAALLLGKRYEQAIEYGKKFEKKFNHNYSIPWYVGDGYFHLEKYDEAIIEYNKSLKLFPQNDIILNTMARCYLYEENFEKASQYMKKALAINPKNPEALSMKEYLENMNMEMSVLVDKLFREKYLYYEELQNYEEKASIYLKKDYLANQDIEEMINQLKKTEDAFTYITYGKAYTEMKTFENRSHIFTDDKDDYSYIKINNFFLNTDSEFIDFVDHVENTQDKNLIIDLRYNSGGVMSTANVIADILLPKCITSSIVDNQGNTYDYYSDPEQIHFKKIYIFVDNNTASAAELLALTLKKNLDNVIIIGQKTFGKGVGQYVYEDRKRDITLFIVNHSWNVRGISIMNTGIEPDIYIDQGGLEAYFKFVE